jgi:hypothetical protein
MFIASSSMVLLPEKMGALIGCSLMMTMDIKNFISQWTRL